MIQMLPDFCLNWINWFFHIGNAVLMLSTLAGLIYAGVEIYAKTKAIGKLSTDKEAAGGFPEAAKALVEALSKAPVWLGLFIGGLLLLWVAANEVPKVCRTPAAETDKAQKSSGGMEPPPPADATNGPTVGSKDAESGG